jgi:hypothetical protein
MESNSKHRHEEEDFQGLPVLIRVKLIRREYVTIMDRENMLPYLSPFLREYSYK